MEVEPAFLLLVDHVVSWAGDKLVAVDTDSDSEDIEADLEDTEADLGDIEADLEDTEADLEDTEADLEDTEVGILLDSPVTWPASVADVKQEHGVAAFRLVIVESRFQFHPTTADFVFEGFSFPVECFLSLEPAFLLHSFQHQNLASIHQP